MLLKVGEKAPMFALPDADMETVDLAEVSRARSMSCSFFYPRMARPVAPRKSTDFSDHEEEFLRHELCSASASAATIA
jgi:peroxiredoxin